MQRHGIATVGLIAVLAIVLGGCGFFTKSGLETEDRSEMLQPQAVGQAEQTIDDLFAEVARRVPAFGGMFLSDDETMLQVYLTDLKPSIITAVQAAITAVFGSQRFPRSAIRVIQGQYGFLQLKNWHDRMAAVVLGIPGVTLTDIDDARNRLTIGVEQIAVVDLIKQELSRLGIPQEVVNFEETGPIDPISHTTLQSKIRPVDGGLQITFVNSFGSAGCTLGFNAIRVGVSGFVTNSHCTHPERMGIVDNTVFHQPTVSGTINRIGTEIVDPPFFSFPACPIGRRCRYSDSVFSQYDSGVSFNRGYIARTTGLGSITIDHASPRFRIAAKTNSVILGENLSKIGKTTGWTQGPVVAVCQNVNLGWTADLTLLCQHRVRANAAGGDSGSPVFKITNSPSSGDITLYGILWGRRQPWPWDPVEFWFSSIFDVESSYSELGPLTTCAPGFSC